MLKDIALAACEHRDLQGNLILAEMMQLHCKCTFRSFEPLEEYRHLCPRILVICRGEHAHPIPLPTKTPPSIQADIVDLLESLDQDLPDLTPRRFLRHSVTTAYLRKCFPAINNPNLADLHISLANRDHIKTYIIQVQKRCFPLGTGWAGSNSYIYIINISYRLCTGLRHLKECQDNELPSDLHYIRCAEELPLGTLTEHEEDEPNDTGESLQIIICMTRESSRRLLRAQYLQSDIAFKRVAGFLEFETGGWNQNAQIGLSAICFTGGNYLFNLAAITYCRVYVNRQSAAAHHLIFQRLETIVRHDTGESLKWRHLHGKSLGDFTGILQWTGDQHGGQAKGGMFLYLRHTCNLHYPIPGLGLHLKTLAAKLPPRNDLHEPHRMLSSLSEYEHLHRIFRLCHVHVTRNIRGAAVPESVKNKMRSLICIEHRNLEGCLRDIANEGGKVGAGA